MTDRATDIRAKKDRYFDFENYEVDDAIKNELASVRLEVMAQRIRQEHSGDIKPPFTLLSEFLAELKQNGNNPALNEAFMSSILQADMKHIIQKSNEYFADKEDPITLKVSQDFDGKWGYEVRSEYSGEAFYTGGFDDGAYSSHNEAMLGGIKAIRDEFMGDIASKIKEIIEAFDIDKECQKPASLVVDEIMRNHLMDDLSGQSVVRKIRDAINRYIPKGRVELGINMVKEASYLNYDGDTITHYSCSDKVFRNYITNLVINKGIRANTELDTGSIEGIVRHAYKEFEEYALNNPNIKINADNVELEDILSVISDTAKSTLDEFHAYSGKAYIDEQLEKLGIADDVAIVLGEHNGRSSFYAVPAYTAKTEVDGLELYHSNTADSLNDQNLIAAKKMLKNVAQNLTAEVTLNAIMNVRELIAQKIIMPQDEEKPQLNAIHKHRA